MTNRFVAANRELWEEWAEINYRSDFYAVEEFTRTPTPLDPVVRAGLGPLAGKRVLHLQCHFGMDTLRVAREAAHATGVDFSPKAIELARQLATATGIPARFIESDLYALPDVPELRDETFDIVFASYGAIPWLPDLRRWGEIVARYVAPGGHAFLAEGHPTMLLFDGDALEPRVQYGYFHEAAPIVIGPRTGNYADPDATYTKTEYSWQHTISDVVMALRDAGLAIDELREHASAPWKALSFLVESEPGVWTNPPDRPALPLTFSIRASRPSPST